MRDIKFRAWNNKVNKWVYKDLFCIDGFGIVDIGGAVVDVCTIEQYTGLKDKNGKEIYEGDILKAMQHLVFPVAYDKGRFFFKGKLSSFNTLYESLSHAEKRKSPYEVIGNIHENPELL